MRFSVWPVAPQPWADTLALGRPGERVDRSAEGLALLDSLLSRPTTSFAGSTTSFPRLSAGPSPCNRCFRR
jgi:hypothetical protein